MRAPGNVSAHSSGNPSSIGQNQPLSATTTIASSLWTRILVTPDYATYRRIIKTPVNGFPELSVASGHGTAFLTFPVRPDIADAPLMAPTMSMENRLKQQNAKIPDKSVFFHCLFHVFHGLIAILVYHQDYHCLPRFITAFSRRMFRGRCRCPIPQTREAVRYVISAATYIRKTASAMTAPYFQKRV